MKAHAYVSVNRPIPPALSPAAGEAESGPVIVDGDDLRVDQADGEAGLLNPALDEVGLERRGALRPRRPEGSLPHRPPDRLDPAVEVAGRGDEPDRDIAAAAVPGPEGRSRREVAELPLEAVRSIHEGDRLTFLEAQLRRQRAAGAGTGVGDGDGRIGGRIRDRLGEDGLDRVPLGVGGVGELGAHAGDLAGGAVGEDDRQGPQGLALADRAGDLEPVGREPAEVDDEGDRRVCGEGADADRGAGHGAVDAIAERLEAGGALGDLLFLPVDEAEVAGRHEASVDQTGTGDARRRSSGQTQTSTTEAATSTGTAMRVVIAVAARSWSHSPRRLAISQAASGRKRATSSGRACGRTVRTRTPALMSNW